MKSTRSILTVVLSSIFALICIILICKHLFQGPNASNSYLSDVAINAMNDNGYGNFLQGEGANRDVTAPHVISRSATRAVVTIPYMTDAGPSLDPQVNLVFTAHTDEWNAVSIVDGAGKTHPIDWHPH